MTTSDSFDRLMTLWQEPWSEAAFGEAQMLIGQLRAALAQPEPLDADRLAKALVAVMTHPDRPVYDGFEWYGAANDLARDVAAEYVRLEADPT